MKHKTPISLLIENLEISGNYHAVLEAKKFLEYEKNIILMSYIAGQVDYPKLDDNDFQQYLYTAGVTDDGIGEPLPEFIAFAIKIVGQGTNAAEPPRIRDLRIIALAT